MSGRSSANNRQASVTILSSHLLEHNKRIQQFSTGDSAQKLQLIHSSTCFLSKLQDFPNIAFFSCLSFQFMLTSLGPQVYHLTSSHLISPHLISFHVISSLHILSHLISSHLISSHLISSHLISSHLLSSHLILSAKLYAYNHCIHCMQLLNTAESTIALGFLIGFTSMQEVIPSPYLPVSPLMVFMAMTVEEAMPPKLKLQSLIRRELEFTCFSNNTLIAVFTTAMSSSRRRACLKAKTYSCYKKFQIQIMLIIYNHSKGVRP